MSENEVRDRSQSQGPRSAHGLTGADVERALARTRVRGGQLVRRRHQRRAAYSAAGVVVLLATGFGVLNTLSTDDGGSSGVVVSPAGPPGDQVSVPATSTTTAAPVPTSTPAAPDGFVRTDLPGGVTRIDNTAPRNRLPVPPPTAGPDGVEVQLGPASTQARVAAIEGIRTGDHTLIVSFPCDETANYVDHLLYRLDGSTVTVEAWTVGIEADGCSGNTAVEITFPDQVLPAGVTAVAGLLATE